MLDFIEKYKSERIKYKYPKNTLFLSSKISLNKNNINNYITNNNQYIINSEKLKRNFPNYKINQSIEQNSFNPIKNNTNNNIYTTKSYRLNSNCYNNSDNQRNFLIEIPSNRFNNQTISQNHNLIINNSVKNHIQNFLRKYNNIKTTKNNNEFDKKYLNKGICKNNKNNITENRINKNNVVEVEKELEIVNDKKLKNNNLTVREDKNDINDILSHRPRVFSQNKNEYKKIKYYKIINGIKNKENIQRNQNREKELKKFNLKCVDKINYFNTINNHSRNYQIQQKNRNPYTSTRINQSIENRQKFIIKSFEKENSSRTNILNHFNTIDNQNSILLKEKLENNEKSNTKIINIKEMNNKKEKIQEPGEVYLENKIKAKSPGNHDNTYFSNISSLIKSDGNLNIQNNNYINNFNNKDIYKNTNLKNFFNINNSKINCNNSVKISNKNINENNKLNSRDVKVPDCNNNNKNNFRKFNNNIRHRIKTEEEINFKDDFNEIEEQNNTINKLSTGKNLNKSYNFNINFNSKYRYKIPNNEENKNDFINEENQKYLLNKDFYIKLDQNSKENNNSINRINNNFNNKNNNIISINSGYNKKNEIKISKEIFNKIKKLYPNSKILNINQITKKKLKIKTENNLLNDNIKQNKKCKKLLNKSIKNKKNSKTINLNDSEILDINRLDLEIENNDFINKLNKYKDPKKTTNDIIYLFNKKNLTLDSNDNFEETKNSINSKNKIKDNGKETSKINKDLDLSNVNSFFNSRFNYVNEKKQSLKMKKERKNLKENIRHNFKKKKLTKDISNYFCFDNKKIKDCKNGSNQEKKIKFTKKMNGISSSRKIIKNKINKNNDNNNNGLQNIKIKNYKLINNSNIVNSISYEVNNEDLLYLKKNQNQLNNNSMNFQNNKLYLIGNNNLYKKKISINKKILTNKNIVPNLYYNLYKSRNSTFNSNDVEVYNSSVNEQNYKLSESEKNPIYTNNTYNNNNYTLNFAKINNNMKINSFRHPKNQTLNYFTDYFDDKLNNYYINNENLNLNNYFSDKNKKLKNKMAEYKNLNSEDMKANNKKNDLEDEKSQEEEEIEEEENEEEEEVQSHSREEKTNTNNTNTLSNINKNTPKAKYLLELKENGLPDLPKNKILSCNIGSLINISIYNGLPISNNISLITDSFQIFPTSDFANNLIKESSNNGKNKKYNKEYFETKVNSYKKYPSMTNTKIFFQVMCERAGNITFLFMYTDEKNNNKIKFTEPFYILVNPLIDLSNTINDKENENNKNIIEISQIRMQTVISKNIGKLKNDFENYYEEASLLGYNFIHFKTLQSLSSSDNLYSIKDHNDLNNSFFTDKYKNNNIPLSPDEKNDLFQNTIKRLKQQYKIGAITDVILTQASTESEWILEHNECAYNLENSPWLNVAYKLDEILINYSNLFYNKKVSSSCAPFINNLKDLEEVMEEISNEVYKNNLEEYFLIQINEYMDKFKDFYNNYLMNQDKEEYIIKQNLLINEIKKDYALRQSNYSKNKNNINYENIDNDIMNESIIYDIISQSCKNYGYKRYGVEMPIELISLLIIEKYRIKSRKNELINNFEFLQEIKNYINLINKEWLGKSKEMIKIALLNVKEFIRYQFIQLNRLGIKRQLIDSYFYVIDKNDPKKILLCNGWIMQSEDSSNYYPDITAYGTWYYFKRKVIIWKDTIKINYHENISKTPEFLLNYMTKYINFLSNVFEGLYIESLSNLPMFVLKYFIHKARQVNPNIIFMTQLPTIDDESDEEKNNILNEEENVNKENNIQKLFEKKFTEELGINLFIHEIIWDCSNNELLKNILSNVNSNSNMSEGKIISKFNSNLYSMSKRSDNKIYFGSYEYLRYHKPFCILYDLTQDNQSYYEKYNIMAIQNAMMASIGMLDCAIGSTRGFDQLFPFQISSQKEQRLYYFENYKIKNLVKKVINIKENEPNNKFQEVIFEFNTNNILLNDENNHINININNIKSVKLALSYHNWKPDIELEKMNKNLFMTKIKLPNGRHYYKYVIEDNLWICDSTKPVEVDKSKNMNNYLNLNIINNIAISDITLLRCYINNIREKFYNKKSEIFLQNNNDLFCIIRMITDSKSLINNNIDDDIVNEYKNNLSFKPPFQLQKNFVNNNTINYNTINFNNDMNKNDNKNINYDYNQLIKDELNIYEGYAIITRPTYKIIDGTGGKGEIIIPGKIDSIICSFYSDKEEDFEMNNILDNQYLLGINNSIYFNKDLNYLNNISTVNYYKTKTIIRFHNFPPNSILILKFTLENEILNIIDNLNDSIEILFNKGDKFVDKYNLHDISKILYQTENEEKEISFQKRGTYELSIFEDKKIEMQNKYKSKIKFIYSGIHQIIDIIKRIKRKEKQNILFNDNINNGIITSFIDDKKFIESLYYDIAEKDSLMEYLLERMNNIKSFTFMNEYIKKNIIFNYKQLPSHLKPLFFESIMISLYQNIIRISLQNISFLLLNFGDFATALSLCRYEFFGTISPSSSFMHDLTKNLNNSIQNFSISKGIPYNTVGSERMYFRDTLIGFKSLFLISNSYKEGKNILKIIASCLRHGLIPDFFDQGEKPRYNSRDTCWYFINAVKNYINYSKDYNFLKEEIELIFSSDNSFNEHLQKKIKGEVRKYSLESIIHIIFQSHAKGIHFREWDYDNNNYFNNNYYQKKEGYNIDIELDPNTGFIYGGNYCNNGTWMNKLGNSIKAKNKGIPATPRPGADIEIIALVFSCLDFIVDMGNKNYFKFKSVELSNGINYPYSQWKLLIKDSFEDEFFVKKYNIDISNNYNDWNNNQIKGNIYKDYKNKSNVNIYEFQLRPNFLIALYISPELFTLRNIINSLNNVELFLLRNENNVIGLKTLDKTDKEYYGLYDNKETNNFFTSCGFNLNNGIEYTWLYGLYLILKIKYFNNNSSNNILQKTPDGNENGTQKLINYISSKLIPIMNIIKNNKWFGIPEMTDELGNIIKDGNQSDLKAFAIFYELIDFLSKLNVENENDNDYSNDYIDNSNVEI